jgi:hypothetical protein
MSSLAWPKVAYFAKVQKLFDTFFGDTPNRGDTSPKLRQAIERYAASLSGTGEIASIPPELETYLKKVTLYAYKVTDEDIAQLKALDYTEDEVFEITISAALGAGRTRLEYGLAALKESSRVNAYR